MSVYLANRLTLGPSMNETSADERLRSIVNAAEPILQYVLQTTHLNSSGILSAAFELSRRIKLPPIPAKVCHANKIGSLLDLGCPVLGGLVRSHRIANRHSAFHLSPTGIGGTFPNYREGIR